MSNTIIIARIYDQTVQFSNLTGIASGSKGVLQIQCEFDNAWDGYGKTAVFYRDTKKVFHRPIADDVVTVPDEVLAEAGSFYFGVFGVSENTRTTSIVRLDVQQGAITEATAVTEEPTPDVYSQIMAAYGRMEARMREVIAMRGSGVTEFELSGDGFRGTICSNGASAFISLEFIDLPLTAASSRTYLCIPPEYAPLGLVVLKSLTNWQDATITISPRSWTGTEWAQIEITAGSEDVTDIVKFEGYYDLESVFIPELADARVDAKGNSHPTAGDAVRAQAGEGSLTVYIDVDGRTASHTAAQILEASSGDQDVRASISDDSARYLLQYVNTTHAVFAAFSTDNSLEKYIVDNEGEVRIFREYYVTDDVIGDISAALDELHTYAQGLHGLEWIDPEDIV